MSVILCFYSVFTSTGYNNPCCSYPCENNGVCMTKGDSYSCDCANLDFYGKHCEIRKLFKIC